MAGLDFFLEVDPFPLEPSEPVFDEQLMEQIVRETPAGCTEVEVAVTVLHLVREDLALASGDGGDLLDDAQMALAIRALEKATKRTAASLVLPFSDHSGWWRWSAERGADDADSRRALLSTLFDATREALQSLEQAGSSS